MRPHVALHRYHAKSNLVYLTLHNGFRDDDRKPVTCPTPSAFVCFASFHTMRLHVALHRYHAKSNLVCFDPKSGDSKSGDLGDVWRCTHRPNPQTVESQKVVSHEWIGSRSYIAQAF